MKLRRFIAALLALVLLISNSPLNLIEFVWATETTQTIAANNADLMLWSKYVKNTGSQLERDGTDGRTHMIDDHAYVDSLLTDAAGEFNKSGEEWVWFAYKVTAGQAGEYTLGLNVTNISNQRGTTGHLIPICVDGKVYTVTCDGKGQSLTTTVNLTAGSHVVVMFMPMPKNASDAIDATNANSNAWKDYTWICVNKIIVDSALTVSKPTETEVEECFSTTYKAGDQNYVTRNKYNDNGDTLGSSNRDGLKNNRVSVETLVAKGVKNAAYAAFTVYAPEAGEYGIHAMVTTDANLTSDQVALVVDGKQAVAVPIAKSAGLQRIQTNVTLAAGVHTILITSPMPLTDEEAQAIPAGNTDGWAGMNGKYRWMDFSEIIVDSRLAVAKVATDPTVTRIEADDTGYVVGGTKVSYADASFGAAVELKVNSKQLVTAAQKYNGSTLMQMDWGKLSVARFAVKGEGTQAIKLDVIAACASGNESDAVPTVYVYVNGRIYEKTLSAWNTKETVTIDAALTGGVDVVKVFAAADAVSDGTRVLLDAVLLDNANLTAVAVADMDAKTVVSFGDTSKVLINKFNNVTSTQAGGADLRDTRYSKYYIDGLRGEQLYRIPYVAVTVNAAKAGYYDISVAVENNTAADTSEQLALMVDGKVYTMRFNRASNATLCATVYLEQGTHMLVFTAAMPQDKATADTKNDSNQSKLYPWINFKNLTLDPGLTIGDKPGAGEVEYAEPWHSGFTIVDAGDESYVIANKYTDNGTTLGGANSNALKENRVSLETLLENGLEIAPNASFFVIAPADGTYDIYATVQTDNKLTSGQVALVVDGTAVTAVTIKSQKDYQIIHAEVTLKKGAHTIALTSPMPQTDAEAQAIPAGETDGWVSMNGKYNWMDMIRFAIDGDLTVVKDATDSTTTGIEAEDETYVKYHGNYASQIFIGASAGFGVGGTNTVIAPSLVPASGTKYVDWTKLSYVEFAVTGAAGEQEILLDLIATRADDNTTDAIPKVYVYVNGKVYEKTLTAWNTKETVAVKAELTEGINVVKFFAAAETVSNGTYVLFDAFSYDVGKLTAVTVAAVEASKTQNSFGNTEKVLTNKFGNVTASGIGNAQLGDARWSKYYIDGLNANQLPRIPYAAVKVNADKDGYYDICLVAGPNTGADSQQIAIMIDGKVYPMTFVSAGITTLRATVYLEEGEHLLIFTSPMPLGKATADTSNSENEKSLYPWFNMKKLVLDPGLSIGEIPTALEMEYADVFNTVGTIINAGDESHVIANLFKDNGDTQGNANLNPARENRISLETLLEKGVKNVPGVSFRVTAGEDGSYGIYATISANKALTSYQLALVLDGQKVIPVTVTNIDGNQVICASVELTKGTHTVALTTPMPATEEEAPSVPTNDDWSEMSAAYPWTDFIRIAVDKNLAIEKVAIEAPEGSTELEDEDFFQHHGNYGTEASHGTSGGSVVTGNDTIASADQITGNGAPSYNWSELSYVEFGVDAKGAGKQDITFGVDATAAEEAGLKLLLFVNGQWQEAAVKKDGAGEVTVTVELEAGTNVVRCVVVAQKAAANANIVFDYVKFDTDALKLVKVKDMAQIVVNAGDETKVLFGHYTDKGETLGDSLVGDLRWDSLALEQITCDNLERMPYFALKVNAEADGYYDILLDIGTNNKTVSDQLGLLVDGKDLQILSFKLAASTQIKATVYLKAGTHTLTFTTPMPQTVTELQTYLDKNDLERGNGITHPWMDAKTVTLGKGLKVEAKPHVSEVEYPFYTRMEAENGEYVVYNNYNTPNESSSIASGEKVVGGAWNSIYEQTFEELEAWLDAKHNAYVEYAVYAPADGEYDIRVGFLAGTNDKTVAKPYIAVIANGTTHKVQFTKNWGDIDRVKLTVKLKEGLNIIRCTSMTTEQGLYSVKGWINHDCLDLDTRLTPVKHSTLTVEAEDSKYVNKFKVQDGADYEAASGKVLGNADRKYMTGLKLTLDKLTAEQLWQVPYFAYTVEAPADGYYPISVNMAGDGRMPQGGTMGILVDGSVNIVNYVRTDKTTAGARADALVYLTKGEHILTFTVPIPATAGADVNYSYYWSNMDSVTLYNGLALAKTQKAPATGSDYVRVEVEDHAMFNQSFNNGTASGKAYYLSSQTVAEMLAGGIDGKKTPYAELTVSVDKAGTYTVYLGVNTGMTQGCTIDQIEAKFAVSVNGKLQVKTVHASKSGYSTLIPVEMELKKGANTIQLTHLGKDSQCGGTTWIDFDYVEASKQLTFAANSDKLEAEKSAYGGYSVFANDSYSAGSYLGDPDYNEVDESDITFEKLNPADIGELPYVTYRVHAKKAGTYTLTVGFAAGMHKYLTSEIAAGTTSGFAVIVNGETKQLIEYDIASTNTKMSRLITVELLEGENEITFTTTLAEYIIDHVPYVEETYRKVWIDHDYLLLSESLSAMSSEGGDYDVGDSDHDHAQIETKPSAGDQGNTQPTVPGDTTISDPAGTPDVLVIIWVLVSVCVVAALIILLVYRKRKKNSK